MTMKTGSAPRAAQVPLWERQSWLNAATLESLAEVNEQALALLRAQCQEAPVQPSLLRNVSGLLSNLDAASMRRAAASRV